MTAREFIENEYPYAAFSSGDKLLGQFWIGVEDMMERYSVAKMLETKQISTLTPDAIVKMVANDYGVDMVDVNSRSRRSSIIAVRHVSFYLMIKYLGLTQQAAANVFDQNHATVLSALEKIRGLIDTDPAFKRRVERFENILDKLS
jgi:chromosomal replication initiation ATPase DnaA